MKTTEYIKKCRAILGFFTFFSVSIHAVELGVIGGRDLDLMQPAFATLLDLNGNLIPISPSLSSLIPNGYIQSVSINSSGLGLIGGQDQNGIQPPFAAFVHPDGSMALISTPISNGYINGVSINSSGIGLIGGVNGSDSYIAIVDSSNQSILQFPPIPAPFVFAEVLTVAINNSSVGIAAGYDNANACFAEIVDLNGGFTKFDSMNSPIPLLGVIYSVDINDSGTCLIGGVDNGQSYAVILNSDQSFTLPSPALPSSGTIYSVAINASGTGLIGGEDTVSMGSPAYAAYIDSNGSLTPLSALSTHIPTGGIYGVDINASGVGLIGGQIQTGMQPAFAAFVYPNGSITPLNSLPSFVPAGSISSVAINDAGIGLIGGQDNSSAFAALVAPNGSLTRLSLPTNGYIQSVAIGKQILDSLAPKSFGLFNSVANVMFNFANVLESHYRVHHKKESFKALEAESAISSEIGLLADANFDFSSNQPCYQQGDYSVWTGLFGNFTHQKAEQNIPTYTNEIAGAIALIEYQFNSIQDAVIGGGLAYAFNYVHYEQGIGHASANQEFGVLYASINRPHFFLNAALWGGLYQSKYERHSIAQITSQSTPSGWALSPQLELSVPCYNTGNGWFILEPFAMFDWANIWQYHLHEHGESGFNISLGDQYCSLLRSEIGLRFYEIFKCEWGRLIIEEKGSYINKTPFNRATSSTFFIGSISSFAVETFSSEVQNLGVAEVSCNFVPNNTKYPYGSMNFQGEFGSAFQSYTLILQAGKDF